MTIKNDGTAAQLAAANSKIKTMSKAAQQAAKAKHGNEAAPGERQQTVYPLVGLGKNKQRYTRVNGDPNYHVMGIKTIEDKIEGKLFYLDPDLELPELVERNARITNCPHPTTSTLHRQGGHKGFPAPRKRPADSNPSEQPNHRRIGIRR